jgi:4-amino-4-deoxy-L-arabinose transferase-like glycosyltransferase
MMDAGAAERHTGRDLLILAGLVLTVTLPGLFTRDLWNPDEPRYTEVAREMVVVGDYLVPHLNGQPYPDKPPLFFWLTACFWHLGAGYLSGRLVTMVAVYGILVLVYLAARQYQGGGAGVLAAGAGLSAFLLSYLARRGVIDPLLVLCTTAAALAGYQALQPGTRRRGLYWLVCYFAMALGALEKGPIAFMVPGLVLAVYGVLERRRVRGGGWVHLGGVALFLAVTLSWVIPACRAGGRAYTNVLVFQQQLGQAVDSYSHPHPFYYYVYNCVPALWPWILILPLGMVAALRRRREGTAPLAFFATVWLIATFALFSAISIKRMNYLLPLVPAAGILVGWYFTAEGVRAGGLLKWERVLMPIAFGVALVAAVGTVACVVAAGPALGHAKLTGRLELGQADVARLHAYFGLYRAGLAGVLALPAVVAAVLGLRTPAQDGPRRAAFLAAAMLLLFLPVDVVVNPAENVFKSGRRFGQEIRAQAAGASAVYLYSNNFSGVYNLYSGIVNMPQVDDEARLRTILATPGTLVVGQAGQVLKVVSKEELQRHLVYEEGVGHRQMVLLKGLPPLGG